MWVSLTTTGWAAIAVVLWVHVTIRAVAQETTAAPAGAVQSYIEALRLGRDHNYEGVIELLRKVNAESPSFARAYVKILWAYEQLGSPEKANEYFQELARNDAMAPYGYYGEALYYLQQRRPADADASLRQVIELAPRFVPAYTRLVALAVERQRAGELITFLTSALRLNPKNEAAHYALGYLYVQQTNWTKAAEELAKANELSPGLWEVLDAQFTIAYENDQSAQALAVLGRMLAKAEQSGHLEWKGFVLGRKGMIHSDLADYTAATSELRQATAIAQDLGDGETEEAFRGQLAQVYFKTARYREALAECRTSLEITRRLHDERNEGRSLGVLASIYAEMGLYTEAIENYQQAIAKARSTADRASAADQIASLAVVDTMIGNDSAALANLRTAIGEARALRNPWLEARFEEALGEVLRTRHRSVEALETYRRALVLERHIGDRLGEASTLGYTADINTDLGRTSAALSQFRRALQITEDTRGALIQGRILNDLANCYLRLGKTPEAIEMFQGALRIGTDTQMPDVIWRARAGTGACYEKQDRAAEALVLYRGAIETLEQTRGNLRLAEDKAGFLEDKLDVYFRIISLLVRLHQREPGGGYDEEAFRYSERARARASLDMMAEAEKRINAGVEPALMDQQRQIQRRISLLQGQLAEQYSQPHPDATKISGLVAEIGGMDEEYRDFRREMRARNPRYAAFRYPEPIVLSVAQQMLGDKELLLEYVIGTNTSFLFAATRTDRLIVRVPGAVTLEPLITRFREAVASPPSRTSMSNYWLDAQTLYRDLVAPAGRLLAGREEIIIVADRMLHYLPFDALLQPERNMPASIEPRQLPYLIRKYAISYAPSISVLATVRRLRENRTEPRGSFVALADPLYERAQPIAQSAGGFRGGASRVSFDGLRRLRYSRTEVETIARLYPPGSVQLFLGQGATEENAKSGALARFRYVHFAVHGLINEDRPQLSGLFLSRPAGASRGEGQDGLLQVHEIFDLKLNADLVVLSACSTGLGKSVRGEGLTGFTQAFLYAGASAVAVSLWDVDDRSTADLMVHFYRHLEPGKLSYGRALRQAQLDLIANADYAHPHYWAPFSLIGDSRQPPQ